MAIKIALFSSKTREDFITNGLHHDTWRQNEGKEGDVFFLKDNDAKEFFGAYLIEGEPTTDFCKEEAVYSISTYNQVYAPIKRWIFPHPVPVASIMEAIGVTVTKGIGGNVHSNFRGIARPFYGKSATGESAKLRQEFKHWAEQLGMIPL
jgi:hypothetical protein